MSDWRMTSAVSRSRISRMSRCYPRMTSATSSLPPPPPSSSWRLPFHRGSGRTTLGADWFAGTFEGGIRRQRRKNEEREDLTYSLHVWRGALPRRPSSGWSACADPFDPLRWCLVSPTFGNLDQTTPTEAERCHEKRRLPEHRGNCWSLATRRWSSLCRVASVESPG